RRRADHAAGGRRLGAGRGRAGRAARRAGPPAGRPGAAPTPDQPARPGRGDGRPRHDAGHRGAPLGVRSGRRRRRRCAGRPAGTDPDAAWAAQEVGFFGVLALAQALAAASPEGPVHLDIVTAGTQGVFGDDLVAPEHATLAGPALTLPLELPWLTVRQVD